MLRRCPTSPHAGPGRDQRPVATARKLTDPDSILIQARSQALLDQWTAAVTGRDEPLLMRRRRAELAEAARARAASDDLARAPALSDEAVRRRDEVPAET